MKNPNKSFLALLGLVLLFVAVAMFMSSWQVNQTQTLPAMSFPNRAQTELVQAEPVINPNWVPSGGDEFKKKAVFGFIKSVQMDEDKKIATIKFDQALFLTGEEAQKEARKEMGCGKVGAPEECQQEDDILNNGYYIQNPVNKIYTYKTNADTKIRFVDWEANSNQVMYKSVDMEELLGYFQQHESSDYGDPYLLFWLTEKSGWIQELEEQYTP